MWPHDIIKNNILDRIIIDNQIDLTNYSYYFCLDIKEFDLKSEEILRKTRIVYLHNNKIGQEQL